jgi:2-polyprenyl-6-methoxyphenol hydroxylase-like FAD-dependent oxidoreductase
MTDPHEYEVVVVGGGPVGMWLAADLRRAGAQVIVLEKRAARPPHSKALTIYPRTLEMFAMRGLASRFVDQGAPVPSAHFAILSNRLDFAFLASLGTAYPFTLFLPQRRTEELLAEHLDELGVPMLRAHEVTGIRQSSGEVTVAAEAPSGPRRFTARYVVGCDGAGSVTRRAAGIEFAGTASTWHTILGDVELDDPPAGGALSMATPGGSLYMVKIGERRWRLATVDHAALYDPPSGPVTLAELRASALRLANTDFGMRATPGAWLSRVGNETRQAASYRSGRLFLAGDAAHIHYPAGGQGLNLGLQDAANLGWKLGLAVRGWAPAGLLDSYEAERAPVGLEVIEDSLAQCGLLANPSREGIALRDRFNRLLAENQALSRSLAVRLSGLGIGYGSGGERVPDLALRDGPAPSVYGLLHGAKFVLLARPGSELGQDFRNYHERLDVVTAELDGAPPGWADVRAMLIRPDGYLAWAVRAADEPGAWRRISEFLARHLPVSG